MALSRSSFLRAIEEILGVPTRTLQEQDSRETIEEWTSLADVQIFALVESEFGIEPDDELIAADTVGSLLRILQSRGAFHE